MERNRNKVEVNEDMIKDIMAGDIPVFGKGKQTKSVADRTTSNDYRALYLSPGNVTHRQQTYISHANYQFLKRFLPIVAPEVSISRYVDNILSLHLEQYKDEIDRIYNNEITNPFLTNTQASNRSHVYIDREIVDCIKCYLPIIAPGVSVSGYLSNIFKDHIQCHWNKIHELYINESVKPLKRM